MRRFTSHFLGFSVAAIALSTLLVGVVWAGSSALRAEEPVVTDETTISSSTTPSESTPESLPESSSTTSTVLIATSSTLPPESDESVQSTTTTVDEKDSVLAPVVPLDTKKLTSLVADLSKQIKDLAEKVEKDSERISVLSILAKETTDDVDVIRTRLAEVLKKVDRIDSDLDTVKKDAVSALERTEKTETSVEKITKQVSQLDEEGEYSGSIKPSQLSRKLTPTDLSGDWPLDRTTGDLDSDAIKISGSGCWPDYRYNIVLSADAFGRVVCVRIAK